MIVGPLGRSFVLMRLHVVDFQELTWNLTKSSYLASVDTFVNIYHFERKSPICRFQKNELHELRTGNSSKVLTPLLFQQA